MQMDSSGHVQKSSSLRRALAGVAALAVVTLIFAVRGRPAEPEISSIVAEPAALVAARAPLQQQGIGAPSRVRGLHSSSELRAAALRSLAPPPAEPRDALAKSISRAEKELEKLAIQKPEGFLDAILLKESDPRFDYAASQHVQACTKKYVDRRRGVLERMLRGYIAGQGLYEPSRDLSELRDIDAEFRHSAALVRDRVPQVESISDVLGQTALPIPSFAREAPRVAVASSPPAGTAPTAEADTEVGEETPLIGHVPQEEKPSDAELSAVAVQ